MKVFIDNCVWDELYKNKINPVGAFLKSEFSLHYTPDLKIEAKNIPDKEKRAWVLEIFKQAEQPEAACSFFAFADTEENIPSPDLGFNEGFFITLEQAKYIDEEKKKRTEQ